MPLINFGSILSFAEELEKQDLAFYSDAVGNPACSIYSEMFAQFSKEAKKNIQNVQRTRRENVTEMILENIEGFTRAPYCAECGLAGEMEIADILETANRLEDRAVRYYTAAAEKMKAQSEVARVLKQLGKKHGARQAKLAPL
jgi:tripartite-type tricarboxylate transporter receptor subunit TctC